MLDTAKTKEETISNLVGKAEALKNESKFKESISEWKKLRDILPNNDYVVQQLALVQYKSKYPNATLALGEALNTIQSLNPKKSLDLETIGITGAIYKNLFKLNKNYDYLDEAINYYKKGFIIKNDYYNGENYSNCLLLKTQKPDLEVDEIEYLKFESKKVCREIISLLEENIRDNEINYWMYATLATCYLCLKDEKNYQKYEAEFLANTTIEWEIETYKNTIADTKKILMIEEERLNMAHKCFISFKTEDMDYKKKIQEDMDIDMIDKSLDEPINSDDEDYIMRKIREDYLADSTVTIYLIGEYSAENSFLQDQTYIKRELQASLYNGENNTKNGILGIVLPSMYDKVYKGKEQCSVCGKNHNIVCINDNTTIKEFSYNYYIPKESGCSWSEDERYCVLVKWEDFKNDPETYIDNAFNKRKSEISKKTKVRP